LLRTIVKKQWYRYERACALLIALKRWNMNKRIISIKRYIWTRIL
jgi:hypothetical protein